MKKDGAGSAVGLMLGFLAAMLIGGGSPCWAQATGTEGGVPVHMIVTVEARQEAQPPAIRGEDLVVYQGRDRVPVSGWTPLHANGANLELYLLIDDSLTVSLADRIGELQSFLDGLPDNVEVGLAYMRNGMVDIVQRPTRDHAAAAKLIRAPQAITGGSSYQSLEQLIKEWPAVAERREILMVSDGIEPFSPPDTSDPFVQQSIAAAQRAGIQVFTIYAPAAGHWGQTWWSLTWGQTYLSQLAHETGAEGYGDSIANPVSFLPYLDDLSQRLQRQYELTFRAKPPKNGGMQPVRVTTEVRKVDLVAADRVFVPAQE